LTVVTTTHKRHALAALETAKEDLRRDGYLLPVAFVVTDAEIIDFNIRFKDQNEKSCVYSKLVELAREKNAKAIITINDAQVTEPTQKDDSETRQKSAEDGIREECLYMTISGPGIQTWTVSVPYYRATSGIIFGKQFETTDDILNLLPGWGNSALWSG
jgi:hypothetical protein